MSIIGRSLTRRAFISQGAMALPAIAQLTLSQRSLSKPSLAESDEKARGSDFVVLKWDTSAFVSPYEIQVSHGKSVEVRKTLTTPYRIIDLIANRLYSFAVRGTLAGQFTEWSTELILCTRPRTPSALAVASLDETTPFVKISWDFSKIVIGSDGIESTTVTLGRTVNNIPKQVRTGLPLLSSRQQLVSPGKSILVARLESPNTAAPSGVNVSLWGMPTVVRKSFFGSLEILQSPAVQTQLAERMRRHYAGR